MDYFRRFTYGPEQKQFAREVSIRVPGEEPIGVIVKGYPLRYLSGARVISLPQLVSESGGWSAAEHLPKWMALTSEVGDYRFLRPEAHSWFKDNTKLEVQVGKNALYRVTGPYPEKPLVLLSIQEPLTGHPLARDSFGAYRWGDSGYNAKAKSGPRQ
jgi:hypothetical protein